MSKADGLVLSNNSSTDDLTIHIDNMLKDLSDPFYKPSMYRVSDQLRRVNPEAYDPDIVSIGPFHRDKQHLKKMEFHKYQYLKRLLARRNESSVDSYVAAVKFLEEEARKCYAEPIELESDEFVQMLLLDGIFVIEFLRKYDKIHTRRSVSSQRDDDAIFQFGHVQNHLLQDFLLYENQLPLFIIEKLLDMSKTRDNETISNLIWPLMLDPSENRGELKVIPQHLLGLVHSYESLQFRGEFYQAENMENMKSAKELTEHGIVFKTAKAPSCLLDIKFKSKKLMMPMLPISDSTESWLKNMIAYEYYLPESEMKFFSDYAFFLHCLIHSPDDAELLRHCGIISNWLGGDEMVYHMINQLGMNVQISEKFSYNDVFKNVNRYCEHRRNRWMAILRRDYFNTPWKLISLLGVIAILLLTFTQTTFATLAYVLDVRKGS